MYKAHLKTIELGDGRTITIETGKLAKQADGSVVVKMGDTMLLATVVSAKEAKDHVDFMPLSVDYHEKFASVGRFPGGFLRREGRPGETEVLVARLVDRALRPLFPDDYHADTFVTISLISADKNIKADALAGLAASAALAVSDVPFHGPISEVRVGRIDGEFIINPTLSQMETADIDIMIGATMDNVLMVEGEMSEVSENEMIQAIEFGHIAIKKQCQAQIELAEELGVTKREYNHEEADNEELKTAIDAFSRSRLTEIARGGKSKHERKELMDKVCADFVEEQEAKLTEEDEPLSSHLIGKYFHAVEKDVIRNILLDEAVRLDGRKPDEIRPIWCEVNYLPTAHGSAIFTRGETQSLTTVTLGTKVDEKIIDEALRQGRDKFLLHYNFPPFSTGDARPTRGISRREMGHGNLAHRAIKGMIPANANNPYTIRIVSDILESNGSSSMATVCAATLALMDAGIQIKKPVSGIAMGLITDPESGKYTVLSDILGDEDHLGDMDFKVTGTEDGITACQMDIKVEGLSYEILAKALEQARQGRLHILKCITDTISAPNDDLKPHAPRIEKIMIARDMIGAVIGPGGKIIQQIQSETNTVISIDEVDGKGQVLVSAENKESIDSAMKWIHGIVDEPDVGEIYKGRIKSIASFGAFVEIMPGKEGLLHISEIEWRRLRTVEEVLKEGDMVEVKLIDVDKKTGKLKLSRKVLLPRPPRENR